VPALNSQRRLLGEARVALTWANGLLRRSSLTLARFDLPSSSSLARFVPRNCLETGAHHWRREREGRTSGSSSTVGKKGGQGGEHLTAERKTSHRLRKFTASSWRVIRFSYQGETFGGAHTIGVPRTAQADGKFLSQAGGATPKSTFAPVLYSPW